MSSLALKTVGAAFAALAFVALPALAQDRGHGPPQEALTACRGRSRGASCSVTPRGGGSAMQGTCDSPSDEQPLACRPADGQGPRGQHGPPPEAFTACEDTNVGDACVVDTPRGTMEGVCRAGQDGRSVCAPNRRPPGGRSAP